MESLQNTDQRPLPVVFQGPTAMPAYDKGACDEPDLSIPHKDVLYPFPDASRMNDIWQLPAMVGISAPILCDRKSRLMFPGEPILV